MTARRLRGANGVSLRRPRRPQNGPGPAQFVGEVRSELKKVIWPTRGEIVNYSIVVFITIVILTAIIAGLDWILGEGVLRLFDVN
ncbi:preprotein translocase subunit SecE [Candidatus Poriferisodalis sp.]|uniref:preprotein translocase subunit SecE n=1 Tax=Candidatus Poriferisodalis sp. TaxID=3101277 RepID=UPI003AF52BC1